MTHHVPLEDRWVIANGTPVFVRVAEPAPTAPAIVHLHGFAISGSYMVPMQHNLEQWMAYWNYMEHPQTTPIYGYQLPVWWRKPN